MGGEDITEFLYVLLQRIKFPYRDCDLSNSYDWAVMEDLKYRLCTLLEVNSCAASHCHLHSDNPRTMLH
jgi:actin-related protein 8